MDLSDICRTFQILFKFLTTLEVIESSSVWLGAVFLRTMLLILESTATGYRQASELWAETVLQLSKRRPGTWGHFEKLCLVEVFLKLLEEDFPSKVEAATTTELLLARVLCGQRPGNLQRKIHCHLSMGQYSLIWDAFPASDLFLHLSKIDPSPEMTWRFWSAFIL